MQIDEIFIYSFGKLKGYRLRLNKGLNTIYKENGYGKSTIAIFIKSMLYSLSKEERLMYLPWDKPSSFGGEMVITLDKQYKIVKEFDSKREKLDKVRIFDTSSSLEIAASPSFFEDYLKLNSDGFKRSIYIPDYEIESFGDDIECRLAELIGGGDDIKSYDDAIKALDLKAKSIKSSSKKGEVVSLEGDLMSLENEINSYKLKLKSMDNVRVAVDNINKEKEELLNKKSDLKDKLNLAGKEIDSRIRKAIMDRLKGEINSKRNDINNINSKIGSRLDLNELNRNKALIEEYEGLRLNTLDIKRPSDKKLETVNSLYKGIKNNKRKKISGVFISLAIILLILGILASIFYINSFKLVFLGIITSLIGVLFFILAMSIKDNSKDIEKIRGILAEFKIYKESLDEGVYILRGLSIDNTIKREAELKEILDLYFKSFDLKGSSYNDKIIELEGMYNERKILISDVNNKISEYNSYLNLTNKNEASFDIFEINKEIDEIDIKLDNIARDLGVLNIKLSSIDDINNIIESLEERKSSIRANINLLNDDLRILNLTKDYLKRANDKILNLYLKPMKESLDKYLILLKDIDTYTVDTSFNLTIDTSYGGKDMRLYSRGMRAIIYFLMRLALVDILFLDLNPFIILDDPFINLDDDNLNIAKSLVKRIGKDKQVIYFTCIKERCIN